MDSYETEDKLLAVIGLLSAALVTVIVVFLATWLSTSRATPLNAADTEQCQPARPFPQPGLRP
ncbi:hypothetical protein BTJ39_06515 [Izhakiella australiensis]|uniref:Uncharacterized protein n=1 Tax=Izhakiella australiensis TaxID=1926881 RepID=A0A1S8YNV5_9GAMM|nr:hypothetical protein [Izhakiella australiensis]OON40730.1 hypothetical protein BTJ39_06515 [Izhakiella australiensis]